MNRLVKYGVSIALFLCYFLAYSGQLSHIIAYHEQHHLFLFSKAYFLQRTQEGGLLYYATDFIIQFFYYPLLGSALLALLIASVYLLANYIVRKLLGTDDLLFLSVLPSLGLFYYTMSADHSLTIVTLCLFLLAVAALVIALVGIRHSVSLLKENKLSRLGKKAKKRLCIAVLSVYAVGGYAFYVFHYNRSEGLMLKAEMYVKQRDWQNVLTYTELYLSQKKSNSLISYFHNLALYHTGQLPERLFDYPQMLGVKGLYFPWQGDSRESEYGHFIYEELGYINEAQRWETEAMVVWGETAPHLVNLARYAIANGRTKVAEHFIKKLEQSLFYRDVARELREAARRGEVSDLHNALAKAPERPARFANVTNIGPELEYLCQNDPENKMAFEYLMADLLLSNHVKRFAQNLKMLDRFHYAKLPRPYEEALYIYQLGVTPEEFAQVGYEVSPATKQRFERYYALVQARQMQALQAEFGNSYWFYLNFVSPYGNKVIDE